MEGECRLDVRGFGIAPTHFLGLKVDPEVKVRIRIVAEQED